MPSSGFQTCALDRKSTRLNSSHTIISYAVFCLKKNVKWIDDRALDVAARVARHALDLGDRRGAQPVPDPGAPTVPPADAVHAFFLFFFNERPPPEIYPLSLPGPLPI